MVLICRTNIHSPWTSMKRTLSSRGSWFNNTWQPNPTSEMSKSPNNDESQMRKRIQHRATSDPENDFNSVRRSHENNISTQQHHHAETFDKFVADQRTRARRSILVRFDSKSSEEYDETYFKICRQLKNSDISVIPQKAVSNVPIVHSPNGSMTFFLLETESREILDKFIQRKIRRMNNDNSQQPCWTRIVHFTADLNHDLANDNNSRRNTKQLKLLPGTDMVTLNKVLKKCQSVTDQMYALVARTSLTEDGVRLRFFVASLIEDAFRGVFPIAICTPFGSTTNGFGHSNSDLDMDFASDDPSVKDIIQSNWRCPCRRKGEDERKHIQRMVELIGRMIQCCMPYCSDINRIGNARVPIVKFYHEAGGFECDVTVDNSTGAACSKILWTYSRFDRRVRPLMFTIRRWAASLNITRDVPGHWLTNFQLLCLIMHFLHSRSILPPIKALRRFALSNEQYGIIGDPGRLASQLNSEKLGSSKNISRDHASDLLQDFFKFYGFDFNFHRLAIDLENGTATEKTEFLDSALVIINPLEANHNIAKNVTGKELKRFRSFARAAFILMDKKDLMERSAQENEHWGLLKLFDASLYSQKETKAMDKSNRENNANGDADADEEEWTEEPGVLLLGDELEIKIDGKTRKASNRR